MALTALLPAPNQTLELALGSKETPKFRINIIPNVRPMQARTGLLYPQIPCNRQT